MKVLFLSHIHPNAANGLGVRIRGLLRHIDPRHRIVIVAVDDGNRVPGSDSAATALGPSLEGLLTVGGSKDRPVSEDSGTIGGLGGIRDLLDRVAPRLTFGVRQLRLRATGRDWFPAEDMCRQVGPVLSGFHTAVAAAVRTYGPFDLVEVDEVLAAWLPEQLWDLPRVLTLADVRAAVAKRDAHVMGDPFKFRAFTAYQLGRFERHLAESFDTVITVTDADARELGALAPEANIAIVDNALDWPNQGEQPPWTDGAPDSLLFAGYMSYAPNVDAVSHFAEDILPRVAVGCPGVRLEVVGADPHPSLTRLHGPRIRFVGAVPDTRQYLRDARVVVIPLRRGGNGTKLKFLEALAAGKPVVTTPLGCSGVQVEHGRHAMIAHSARQFADYVIELLGNEWLRGHLGREGRLLVRDQRSPAGAARQLEHVYARTLAGFTVECHGRRQSGMARLSRAANKALRTG